MLVMVCFFALLYVTFLPFNLLRKLAMIEHLICSDPGLHDQARNVHCSVFCWERNFGKLIAGWTRSKLLATTLWILISKVIIGNT